MFRGKTRGFEKSDHVSDIILYPLLFRFLGGIQAAFVWEFRTIIVVSVGVRRRVTGFGRMRTNEHSWFLHEIWVNRRVSGFLVIMTTSSICHFRRFLSVTGLERTISEMLVHTV